MTCKLKKNEGTYRLELTVELVQCEAHGLGQVAGVAGLPSKGRLESLKQQ